MAGTTGVTTRMLLPATLAALTVLLIGGASQRWLDGRLLAIDAAPVRLEQPLATLPMEFDRWQGDDIPLRQRNIELAGCDDHINRRYRHAGTGQVVDLYVAYAARPARMLGHQPQVCYPAQGGWVYLDSRLRQLHLPDGAIRDCVAHHFLPSQWRPRGIVVVTYYVLQGRPVADPRQFQGLRWRLPNLARNPSIYVAQVQVGVVVTDPAQRQQAETAALQFAALVAPRIDAMLPPAAPQA